MSAYELDDDVVRAFVTGRSQLVRADRPMSTEVTLAGLLAPQLPPAEPDREYLVKDKEGDIWRWDVRQSAWHCLGNPAAYARWESLVRDYAPVTLYGAIS